MIELTNASGRNITSLAYAEEKENIAMLNDVIGQTKLTPAEEQIMIWLAGWAKSPVRHIIDIFRKSLTGD